MERREKLYKGVRYREHPTRKHGLVPDRYYSIHYQKDRNRQEEGLGWASDGWTLDKAVAELLKLKEAAQKGEGPTRMAEKRAIEAKRKEAAADEKAQREQAEKTFRQFFTENYLPAVKDDGHDETHFRLWLDPVVGSKPIVKIKSFDLERVRKSVLDAGRSPRTCEYILATFRQVWNRARKAGVVTGDSPSRGVKPPKYDNRRIRFLSVKEQKKLLTALQERDVITYRMALLSLRTGLRASEIFKLRWGCINQEQGTIAVLDTKNTISRYAFMTADLKVMFKSMTRGEHDDLVFPQGNKEPFTEVPSAWSKVISDLGFNKGVNDRRQRVYFHSCRHTFASMHAANGTDMFILKELMGHKVFAMTARYSHLAPETLRAATSNLEKALTKKGEVVDLATGGENHGQG